MRGPSKKSAPIRWGNWILGGLVLILFGWCLFLTYHPRFSAKVVDATEAVAEEKSPTVTNEKQGFLFDFLSKSMGASKVIPPPMDSSNAILPSIDTSKVIPRKPSSVVSGGKGSSRFSIDGDVELIPKEQKAVARKIPLDMTDLPLLGAVPTNGAVPLYGVKHKGGDAIFALACNYPMVSYQRFVGSLRKYGYDGDIVLAVSPPEKMKPGVAEYVKKTGVVAYGFQVDCAGPDHCKLEDAFLGYPDPRPHRTFANIRYALYEYWLRHYSAQSYILILDFRDTFFQGNPFGLLGAVPTRTPKYDLRMYAENFKVKQIANCIYNTLWVERCFGKPAWESIKHNPVICSGSTMGSYRSIYFYLKTMLRSMDAVKCWKHNIESDQGYQNYLFYNGHFNTDEGNATLFLQGEGVVNTIGALNGARVPQAMKGPLDTHWKIRDKEGYILNNDGTKSVCVHQWDRWEDELIDFVDSKLYEM